MTDYFLSCFWSLAANSACNAASLSMSDLGEGSSALSTFLLATLAMVSSVLRAMAAPVELRPCAKLICTGFNGTALSPSKGALRAGAQPGA